MAAFDRNVFVNCPFDKDYLPLFRPLIFTILYLGLKPRIASERSDSGELRLRKIVQLIHQSRFGIHDLSRCQATQPGEFFRLNMPFELGVDQGCKEFRPGKWKRKRFLVLESKRYSHQKALSDLAGVDVKAHGNDPLKIIEVVRNWLVQEAKADARAPSEIRFMFDDFMGKNYDRLVADGYKPHEIKKLPINELKRSMETWVTAKRRELLHAR
jgi:hypothetical protein